MMGDGITLEKAKSLPEIDFATACKTGFFGPIGFHEDDICVFVDDDGISKTVEDTADGFVKIKMI